jgi:hypothetical protein
MLGQVYKQVPLHATLDRTRLTIACSAVLRSNTTMLFTVFGAAFGMQLYVLADQGWLYGREGS